MEKSGREALPLVLICDDDPVFQLAVKHALKERYACRSAMNGDEALAVVRNHPVDVLLLDVQMRTPDEGLRYIPRLKEADPELPIVMSSGITEFSVVREAMRLGATDYVPKDFDPNELAHTIAQALDRRTLLRRRDQQNFEALALQRQHAMIGESPAVAALRKAIDRLRQSDVNVVITGETGTGKEVVARQLRRGLPDGSLAPFVAVDSATIQSSTAESQLFGHEKGAFTGADRAAKGIFEEADGGIVYFDEIANMPLEIQAKLLRALQEREIVRMGSTRAIPLAFRVVCATNKDLEALSKEGKFKDDLYQRLAVVPLQVPPLRDRGEDIPLLLEHFARRHAGTRVPLRFTEAAIEVLRGYSWPGNVRELGNLVAYLGVMADAAEIDVADLPPKIRDSRRTAVPVSAAATGGSFYERVAEFEKGILSAEYAAENGNVSRLAMKLGMDRSHLYTKLREYGIRASGKA